MANQLMQNESLQHKVLKLIPIEIAWAAGTPSIVWNPENEDISVADTATGHVTLTFASASLVPLKCLGHMIKVADANTLSLEMNVDGDPTTTEIDFVINSGADGATETDPVSVTLLLCKYQVA